MSDHKPKYNVWRKDRHRWTNSSGAGDISLPDNNWTNPRPLTFTEAQRLYEGLIGYMLSKSFEIREIGPDNKPLPLETYVSGLE